MNGEGAQCVSCHMPERTYMVVDPRRDHGFRVPRPALSEKIGAPDVCTSCHQDKTQEWASNVVKQQYPDSEYQGPHFAEVFATVGIKPAEQSIIELLAIAKDSSLPDIIRASAVERGTRLPHQLSDSDIMPLSRDESSLVRMASTGLLRTLPSDKKAPLLTPLLSDPVQSVRIEAAKEMLIVSRQDIPAAAQAELQAAMREFQLSMLAKADYPEGQVVLGGVALTMRNYEAAAQAFLRAVEMDPQFVEAWTILIRIYTALGKTQESRTLLVEAIQNNPGNSEIEQLANNMGLNILTN